MKIRARFFRRRAQLSCHQVGELLQTHLDGELDAERTKKVADHLDDCLRCGLEAETYRALRAALVRRAPVDAEPLARLHDFSARLAAGDPELQTRLEAISATDEPTGGTR